MRPRAAIAGLLALVLATTACDELGSGAGGALKGRTVDVVGSWTGEEQVRFEKVLAAFSERTGAEVRYSGSGEDLTTVVRTRVSGGTPPGVALLAQLGLVESLAKSGAIKPVGDAVEKVVDEHYASAWRTLGSVGGDLYGVSFKVSNKSTIWYSRKAFESVSTPAGPPASWEEFLKTAGSLANAGKPAVSIAGADAWTLTDWFENVYLRTAGSANYDKLTHHEIPWTDPSVRVALQELAKLFGDRRLIRGGAAGALQTGFTQSVLDVFGEPGTAAMVFEGDFVAGVVNSSTSAVIGGDAAFFPFPSVNGSAPALVAGGDMAVQFKDDAATTALMKFLASPEAGAIWAAEGGFLSANRNIAARSYPDDVTRELAAQVVSAGDNVRFDMSDLTPPSFGGTRDTGMRKVLQEFLANPASVEETMRLLESSASTAYPR